MPKRDITGKEYYKEISLPPIKHELNYSCFIAVYSPLHPLDFFVTILKNTNYLFGLSPHSLEIVLNSQNFIFKAFNHKDILSKQFAICFVNKDNNNGQYLVGKTAGNACFTLAKSKNRNQLSFSFDEDEPFEQNSNEEQRWKSFKETMQTKSIDMLGEIDYLFPVNIQTYEILKPLFLDFMNMDYLNYRLILPHEIIEVEDLLTQRNHFYEKLFTKENK